MRLTILMILLSFIFNISCATNKQKLLRAVEIADLQETSRLISHGEDVKTVDNDGNTLLYIAFSSRSYSNDERVETVNYLLQNGSDISEIKPYYKELLFDMVNRKIYPLVVLLLNNGADVNSTNDNGYTVLHTACMLNVDLQIVEELVKRGADVNARTGNNLTPLFYCIHSYNFDAIRFLVENGADVNSTNNYGNTILISAVSAPYIHDIISYLLNKGAAINARNKDGNTALMFAAANGDEKIVKLLLDFKADINLHNNYEWSALSSAIEYEYHNIVAMLTNRGAVLNDKSCYYFSELRNNDNPEQLRKIMNERKYGNINVKARNFNNRTILISLCNAPAVSGYIDLLLIRKLLEQGADVNAVDHDGFSPLMASANSGVIDIVKILIEYGADPSLENDIGLTASSYSSNKAIIQLLNDKQQ